MRMTFIVPPEFTVYGVPQRERPPCLIQCDVIELARMFSLGSWKFRFSRRRAQHVSYTAYVRLPAWIIPPDNWSRLDSGEVALRVPLHFNKRVHKLPHLKLPTHQCTELLLVILLQPTYHLFQL